MSQQTGATGKPDRWVVSWGWTRVSALQGGKDWGKRLAGDSPQQFGETGRITCRKRRGSDAAPVLSLAPQRSSPGTLSITLLHCALGGQQRQCPQVLGLPRS